jgi:hypothetical protein
MMRDLRGDQLPPVDGASRTRSLARNALPGQRPPP